MSDDNPYAPPISELMATEAAPTDNHLADRSTRFIAALTD
jgi:hypothetical protein